MKIKDKEVLYESIESILASTGTILLIILAVLGLFLTISYSFWPGNITVFLEFLLLGFVVSIMGFLVILYIIYRRNLKKKEQAELNQNVGFGVIY